MKAKYTIDVTVEEVTFTAEEKKRLKDGEVAFGSNARMSGTGKEATFSAHVSVNNELMDLEEGSLVVTFPDGTQKVLSAEEAKEQLTIAKETPAEKKGK